MAAAARSNPADARIPCPMCGGLIHPIAGRCKHCKGDLAAMRAGRPQAVASLPALLANSGGNIQVSAKNGHANGHSNGHAYAPSPQAAQHVAMPMPATIHDGAQPILPPRPTGRMYAAAATPRTSWWKSWPLIVIALACLAILIAIVLMALPLFKSSNADNGVSKGTLAPPPAPERMDTNPLPPSQPNPPPPARSGDPWSNNGGGVPKPPARTPDIDIPDDPDPGGPTGGNFGGLKGSSALMMSMMHHACDRAAACGTLDSALKSYCEVAKAVPQSPSSAACPAAKRCLEQIDTLSCATKLDDVTALTALTYKFQDCVEALGC